MINVGKTNRLAVVQKLEKGFYLDGGDQGRVFLPERQVPEGCELGQAIDVFVYVDGKGSLLASSTMPHAEVDDVAYMEVSSINEVGAFLDWGIDKDLMVPFSEQPEDMDVGKKYFVYVYIDNSGRIAASTRIDDFVKDTIQDHHGSALKEGQAVPVMIVGPTDLGIKAVVDNTYWGLIYDNEVFRRVNTAERTTAYIKKIRDDGRLDISLYPLGYGKIAGVVEKILAKLEEHDGELMMNDKSSPESIAALFGVSKKVFKQAISALYKDRRITIEKTSIRLVKA